MTRYTSRGRNVLAQMQVPIHRTPQECLAGHREGVPVNIGKGKLLDVTRVEGRILFGSLSTHLLQDEYVVQDGVFGYNVDTKELKEVGA